MNDKMIIQQGERAKYIMTSERWNVTLYDNDFYLEIIYGMQGRKIVILKEDMVHLEDQWIFSFPTNEIVGPVKARLVLAVSDEDCIGGIRKEVDEQFIAFVVTTPCPQFFKCPCSQGGEHDVTYERTEESDIASQYYILCDKNDVPIRTVDDEYLCVLKD